MSEQPLHPPARPAPPTIWIADDSPLEAQLIVHALGSGYRMEVFKDGSSLLERLARSPQRPDVLLLDWVMPDITGEEICRFLRANPETAGLAIILVTASRVEVADVVAGLSAGADDYVSKPFAPEELRARVGAILRAQRLREAMLRQTQRLELVALLAKRLTAAGSSVPAALEALCGTLVGAVGDGAVVWTEVLGPSGPRLQAIWRGEPEAAAVLQAVLHAELAQLHTPDPGDAPARLLGPVARAQARERLAPHLHDYLERFAVSGLVLLPLRDRSGVRGTLAVWRDPRREGFTPEDLALLDTCLDYCALTLENAQLYEAEQRMRARLDATLDQLPVGVLVADEHGRTCLRNRMSREILGDTLEPGLHFTTLEQQNRYEHPSGELYAPGRMPLTRALAGEVVRGEEIMLQQTGGAPRTIRASGAPVMSEDGVPLGGVVAFEDVSEQKAAAREREQIAQFQEQFLGILGHDLRNPLNAITMAATVLTHHPGNEKVLVGRIAASAERMRRMIEQLLDLTRARLGGGIMLATKVVNLSELVSNVVDEIQIASPHCSFILALEPMLLGFWDQGRLEQVFSNVISNAVLYGRPGRPVTINLRGVGALVVCEVHNDNPEGTEIEPEQLSILFEPFRRGRSEYQRSQGLGLGLFIAKEIVTAHHGSIEVASSREQGTTFRIILPLGSG